MQNNLKNELDTTMDWNKALYYTCKGKQTENFETVIQSIIDQGAIVV